ncbi:hypothetical protein [Devosia aurantiaca]|uniref:Uncharacterized protein n=1 Tax=Devosia aurantiaca TaxID=2714858 RepID=A0A6M1SP13_9HYPH|nr:hypothetical protein [Devosia aurantiaca]NGP18938.1 hypothetical protein [Devosia aurantiaca]
MEKLLDTLAGQPLALVVFAVVLALIFGVRYLGLWQGQNAAPSVKDGQAAVAAVIVDPTALNAAAGEVAGLSVTITEAMAVFRAHTAAVDRQSDKIHDLEGGIEKLRDQLVHVAANMK